MLPRSLRLPAREKRINAKRISADQFNLSFWENNTETNRYGFVVSKKISKKAVTRNRLKRVLRSCIEELHGSLQQGFDILFVVKKNFTEIKRNELFQQVKMPLTELLKQKDSHV